MVYLWRSPMALARATASAVLKGRNAYSRKWSFLGLFVLFFSGSVALLAQLDLLPNPPAPKVADERPALVASPLTATAPVAPELPATLEVPAIKLSVAVANPETTDVETLDETLLHGAARYPTSAKLGEEGTTIIFGHSSYLPVVNNPSFKAFNGIQNLHEGDRILVKGETTTYAYAVKTVEKASAEQDGIPLSTSGHTLVLATCDSFGKKTDRFVVTAELVETYPNAS
jgi:LPXTG-site transpeptidase (sortase) family protein